MTSVQAAILAVCPIAAPLGLLLFFAWLFLSLALDGDKPEQVTIDHPDGMAWRDTPEGTIIFRLVRR